MRLTRWLYFAAMAFCLFAGLYTGLRAYFLVLFAQLFLVVSMLLINLWAIYVLTYSQELSHKVCVKGDEAMLHIRLVNERLIPLSLLELHVDVVCASERVRFVFGLAPHAEKEFHIPLKLPYRGKFAVGMTIVVITDIFGLVPLRLDLRRRSYYHMVELLVLPKAEAHGSVSANPSDVRAFSNAYLRHTEQSESVSGARQYRLGDPLKHIHWKKSMRQGDLFVKEFDLPERESILLFVDPSLYRFTGKDALIYADTICECATSIALYHLLRNRLVRVLCGGYPDSTLLCRNASDIRRLQRHLALLNFGGASFPADALHRALRDESACSLFVLTHDATPALSETLCASLWPNDAVTLVLVGGSGTFGSFHTLRVEPGCNAAESLGDFG